MIEYQFVFFITEEISRIQKNKLHQRICQYTQILKSNQKIKITSIK